MRCSEWNALPCQNWSDLHQVGWDAELSASDLRWGGIVGIFPSSGRKVCVCPLKRRKICVGSWRSWGSGRIEAVLIRDLDCLQISATNRFRSGSPLASRSVHRPIRRLRRERHVRYRPQAAMLACRQTFPEQLRQRPRAARPGQPRAAARAMSRLATSRPRPCDPQRRTHPRTPLRGLLLRADAKAYTLPNHPCRPDYRQP